MSKITIRTKIALGLIFQAIVLLAVLEPVIHNAINTTLINIEKDHIGVLMADIVSSVESDENNLSRWMDEITQAAVPIIFWDKTGQIIIDSTNELLPVDFSFSKGSIRRIKQNGYDWLIYDEEVDGANVHKIRICSTLQEINDVTSQALRSTFIVVFLILLLINFIVGMRLRIWAMRPIERLTQLVREMWNKDFQERITGVDSADEIGELAGAFNEMLDLMAETFRNEKRFALETSHELRAPVTVIMTNSEAVLSGNPDAMTSKLVSTIHTESERMKTIINRLLKTAQGMDYKYILQLEPTCVNIVITTVLELLEETARENDIELIGEFGDEIVIVADQTSITHIILNLVSNAIKYGKKGGHVWVKTCNEEDGCLITVADDGIGIAPEDLPYIFNASYRSFKTINERSGSGMGLSFAKWAVSQLKGRISAESEPEKGTILKVWLPRSH